MNIDTLLEHMPIVPYIRESEYAVRTPWELRERKLLDYLLVYVVEGTMLATVDGVDYTFAPGEYCFIQPNALHTLRGVTNTITPFIHFDLFFNPQRRDSFPTKAGQTELREYAHLMQPILNQCADIHIPVQLQPKQPQRFTDLFLSLVRTWEEDKSAANFTIQANGTTLIHTLLKDHGFRASGVEAESRLAWMSAYLQLNLSQPLSVEQMASRANLSPSRFRTLFKAEFGQAPHQYLLHLRLEHARYLLTKSTYSMEQIADYCGFADVHHFSKAFRQHAQQTPSQFRKQK
jgi:AraC-like DNA-binding protein